MTDLPTIEEAARRLRQRQTTPRLLVQDCLDRIERFEAQVRAWVLVDGIAALRQAQAAEDELRNGRDRGPLHGIPVAIKDIIHVRGYPTRAGATILADEPAAEDAAVVARLREAGAIILGKTVTTQFASFDPPPTANPWNLERTPGGSSSGSAAAAALGMCLAALGSQTGGSITRPASFCGVAGLKPTFGRVSLRGILPLAYHMDHPGPIARRVRDLAIVFQAIAGYDPGDPWSVDAAPGGLPERLDRPPRLGVFDALWPKQTDASPRQVTCSAMDALHQAGAEVVALPLPATWDGVHAHHRRIMAVEAAEYHRRWFPAQRAAYAPRIAELLEEGRAASALDYAAALQHKALFRRDMVQALSDVDALVTPATVTTAPPRDTTGDPYFNSPWSYCGLPTISIPCGLADDGLPLSLQLAGPPLKEAALLAVAQWCEDVLKFDKLPPILGA